MGTAADRTVRVLTAGIVAAALGMVGCGPHAAALPAGFPNLDSFSPVPILCLRAIRRASFATAKYPAWHRVRRRPSRARSARWATPEPRGSAWSVS